VNERYAIVRQQAAVDLIDLARQAALLLRDRSGDSIDALLADALIGAAAEVATDMSQPVLS
jgi:hypothetical protein